MPGRVAVLHHPRSFFPLDLREAVGDAAELLWVLPDYAADDGWTRRLLRRLGTTVEISTVDLDAAAAQLAEHHPEGIVTFVDDNLVVAAELAARLGLSYHPPAVARTVASKWGQREALLAAGVPGPPFWALPAGLSTAELIAVADDVDFPVVLKPAAGSGSRGILAIDRPADLVAAYRPDIDQIVEAYLDDDPRRDARFASYLSVETVVSRGVNHHVAVTGRFPLAEPFRETGNFIPAAAEPALRGSLFALSDAAIAALGITTGVLHIEIKLTPDGPQILEVNGRLGGRPPFVLRGVSDINLFRVACEVALDQPVSLNGPAPCRGVAYWRMLQPPLTARRVRDVAGLDELQAAPFVDTVRLTHAPGDDVDWQEGTDGQVVTIRGHVDDLDSLAEAIASIDRTVTIAYDDT
jgi:biotin carboxylase